MECKLIKNGGNGSLMIFFAGWSLSPESLNNFRPAGWDILFIYNYKELSFPVEAVAALTEYSRFSLIAHSFGVAVAHSFIGRLPKMEATIAVCGTLQPINDKYGIPHKIFDLTVKSIGREGFELFNKRMCGDNIKNFIPSSLLFSEQVDALKLLGDTFKDSEASLEDKSLWSVAVICMKDEIIPVDSQVAFWGDSSAEVVGFKTQSHFPFTAAFSQFVGTII